MATGGSGHGYKFLPIIGERIVDVIQGRDRDDLGKELRRRWAWPERIAEDHVWTDDVSERFVCLCCVVANEWQWRGTAAPKGMILEEEYKRTSS